MLIGKSFENPGDNTGGESIDKVKAPEGSVLSTGLTNQVPCRLLANTDSCKDIRALTAPCQLTLALGVTRFEVI